MKLVTLFLLVVLLSGRVLSAPVEPQNARQAALNWLKQNILFSKQATGKTYTITETHVIYDTHQTSQKTAYVFSLAPRGYVVVAADDGIKPIIAYSSQSQFNPEEDTLLRDVIRTDVSNQLSRIAIGDVAADLYHSEWRSVMDTLALFKTTGQEADIYGPHLTSLWGQGTVWNRVKYEYERVFNRYTPNYWPVGCVALAMSQTLYYYEWPVNGVGSHSYTEDDAGTLSANFGATNYGWSHMLDDYGAQLTTNEQKNAAGELTYHCAVSLNMDFEYDGSTSSTSDVPYALHTYFRYTGHYETPGGYSNFYSRMRTNMQNGRVDIIALSDGSSTGHTVNVDGYDANNGYYHLNMGWLGSSNGWYNLEGSFNAGGYTDVTGAVLDIFPEPKLNPIVSSDPEPKTFTVSWKVGQHINADYYQLQQKKGSDGTWSTLSSSIADTFYTVTVNTEGTYYYRVRAHMDGYWWDDSYSREASVTTISNGDYRTQASGNWNEASIWQVYIDGWDDAASAPSYTDGKITIQSGHTVTVTSSVTIDQTTVEEDAGLTVADGVDLSVNNGSLTDLRVYGTLRKEGSARILYSGSGTTTTKFYDGSLFQLAGTNKYILVADWDENSTIEVSGSISGDMTSTYHTDQEFGNFIWDCPGQTGDVYFSGALTTINGDFTLRNTNGHEFRFTGTAGSDPTVTVYGNVNIEGGILNLTSGDNNIYLVCRQDFTQSGGVIKATGNGTGYLRFGPVEGGGYSGTFSHSGGTFTPENIQVNSVFELILNSNMNIGSAPFTINGILNCGTYQVSGSGSFNLTSGGRIKMGHADGLNGNILTTNNTFNAAADYEYIGAANQVTGSDLPTALTDGLIIDSDGDVTLTQNTEISGGNTGLVLRKGRLNTSDSNLLTLAQTGGWNGGGTESFVNGPMVKIRTSTDPFSFPTGKNNTYRRCRIIPASSAETHFKAEYFDEAYEDVTSISPGLTSVSNKEYWQIERTSGATNTQFGMYWDADCGVTNVDEVTTARWDGNSWLNAGRAEVEGTTESGRVTSDVQTELGVFTFGNVTVSDMDETPAVQPLSMELKQNYPNPVNGNTTIRYRIAEKGKVKLELFNILGQRVNVLVNKELKPGSYEYRLGMGRLSSGIYYYRLTTAKHVKVKKLTLIK